MFTRHRDHQTLGEREILGDEERADLLHTIADLVASVAELRSRVDAQFTTIAAHAEIARHQSDLMSREARADLDRSRETLIGLIEQVRTELVENTRQGHGRAGGSERTSEERFDALETHVAELFEQGRVRHDRLADTLA